MTHRHLGAKEVAELLGVSKQWLHKLRARADFPAPADVLSTGPIWHEEDILAWNAVPRPRRADDKQPAPVVD